MIQQRAHRSVGALLSMLLLSACSLAPQTLALKESPPPDLPLHHELNAVPFFPQEEYQCGPAALATVLNDRGIEVDDRELVSEVYLPARKGSLQVEVIAAARRRGMIVMEIEPSLEDLMREVAAGNPVLVLQNLGLDWIPAWHYAVVVGYDLETRDVVLRSGTTQRRITPLTTFEQTWARGGLWGIVVVPPDSVPVTAQPLAYLEAANALEQTGQLTAARLAYQSAHQRWPDNILALLGLGNTEYALGDPGAAQAALGAAIHIDPRSVQAWNNLAYALAAGGCHASARQAAACAVRLAPGDPNVQDTWSELGSGGEDEGACQALACPERAPDPDAAR